MWVRTQDKERLINTDYIFIVNCTINCKTLDNTYYLGSYPTEEKAEKVLDMIEEHLTTKLVEFDLNGNVTHTYYKADDIFIMPKAWEV